jgi:2Fe-2S ferredoxin
MPIVSFISSEGARKDVDVPTGQNVMKSAIDNGIEGIVAECGGSTMCGTCHVYVDEAFLNRLPPMSLDENAMLDATSSPREANSRLSCQIVVCEELSGLTVRIPETQT